MSFQAINLVKTLTTTPGARRLTCSEKLLLWYLADCYNDDKRAAWPSIARIARDCNLSERRVQQLLSGLVADGVLWREPRWRGDGSNSSNWWHFNALDGDPTFAAAIHEQTLQIRGEQAVAQAVRIKRIRKSTDACENGCSMLHPDPATLSSRGCRPSPEEPDVRFGLR
ncbi:MAG: helix-turn-helix domain-containing protein [Terracidiphilus sp.]